MIATAFCSQVHGGVKMDDYDMQLIARYNDPQVFEDLTMLLNRDKFMGGQ